jgi:hypothetical protein
VINMNNVNLLDVVAVLEEMPKEELRAGMRGTVVDIHRSPCLAYEVEFCDDQGRTIALVALLPSQVELVWSRR